jgi:hypothetical protein
MDVPGLEAVVSAGRTAAAVRVPARSAARSPRRSRARVGLEAAMPGQSAVWKTGRRHAVVRSRVCTGRWGDVPKCGGGFQIRLLLLTLIPRVDLGSAARY